MFDLQIAFISWMLRLMLMLVGVQEVIKELDSLSGLEIGSELFFYAVNLFSLKEKWETFVSLKPEMKLNWLKYTHGLESSY